MNAEVVYKVGWQVLVVQESQDVLVAGELDEVLADGALEQRKAPLGVERVVKHVEGAAEAPTGRKTYKLHSSIGSFPKEVRISTQNFAMSKY